MSLWSQLKIELIDTGAEAGTWGTLTNNNLKWAIEESITGRAEANFPTDGTYTLPYLDSNSSQVFRNLVLDVTGTISAQRDLVIPSIEKQYIIENNTIGGNSIRVKTSSGVVSVIVPNGAKAHVFCDGSAVKFIDDYVDINGGSIDGTPIGAASASTGAFSTLTATSATLTNPLPVGSGGTGQSSFTNGQLLIGNSTGNTLSKATLTAGSNVTITNGAGTITIASSGGITGPATTTNNGIVLWDNATGTAVQDAANQDALIRGALFGRGTNATNLAWGGNALEGTANGSNCIAIGDSALANNSQTGDQNIAIGRIAMDSATSAAQCTAIGYVALTAVTTGSYNVGISSFALYRLETGQYNIGIGVGAGYSNISASNNIAIGYHALFDATAGNNIAIGHQAFLNVTTGTDNVVVGTTTGAALTTGIGNVGLGSNVLSGVTTGSGNVAIGLNAGTTTTTGINNTSVGRASGSGNRSNTTCLGYLAAVTGNDQVQLGDSTTTTYVYGTVQNRSDVRDKADIRDTQLGLDFITALRPVDYKWDMREFYKAERPDRESFESDEAYSEAVKNWDEANSISKLKADGSKKRSRYHHGFVAQDVKKLLDDKGIDFGGYQDHSVSGGDDVLSIGYDEFIAPLVRSVQELKAEIDRLKAEVATLKG